MTEVRFQIFISLILTGLFLLTMHLLDIVIIPEAAKIYVLFFLILFITYVVLLFYRKYTKDRVADEQFSKKLLSAREIERKKISSELHDDLQQELNMINFEFKRLAKKHLLDGSEVENLSGRITDTIDRVRYISADLYPQQLEKLGLKKSVVSLINNISNTTGISAVSDISDDIDTILNEEAKINLYRITQELLNNMVKYSEATEAKLAMFKDNIYLHMILKDNGVGMNKTFKELKAYKMGQGIRNVTDRVKLLRGKLDIQTKPGTTFKISIPIKYNISSNVK